MPSILRRSWPFRRRPEGPPDRAFHRSRVWFVLTYVAPVFATVLCAVAIVGAVRDGRWITVPIAGALLVVSLNWWWRMHQPLYEFFGTELWKGRRLVVDLEAVEAVRVFNWRFRAPGSSLVGVIVIVSFVDRDGGRTARLYGPNRLDFDEQREFHAHLRAHGLPIEGDWLIADTGAVIEGTRPKR